MTQDIQGYLLMFHPEEVYELQVHLLRSHPDKPCLNREEIQPEVYYMLEWIAREWEKGSGQSLYRILISAVMNVTLPLMELRLAAGFQRRIPDPPDNADSERTLQRGIILTERSKTTGSYSMASVSSVFRLSEKWDFVLILTRCRAQRAPRASGCHQGACDADSL